MGANRMAIKNKILGVNLRKARMAQARSEADVAQVLQCDADLVASYEHGEEPIPLPALEAMAGYLHTTVPDLLAGQAAPTLQVPAAPAARLVRARIVGALLRKTRQERGLALEDAAAQADLDAAALQAYERGQAVPALALQALAEAYDMPMETFLWSPSVDEPAESETDGPDLSHLEAELLEFVAAPRNLPYIQIAAELSRFPAQGLRAIANALLAAQSSE